MKKLVVLTYIFLLFRAIFPSNSPAQPSPEKYSLAVLNFRMEGGSLYYSDVRFITGEFIAGLIKANLFHTMSQTNMERGLITKNMDPNSACDEMECGLKAASALGVQLLVVGSLVEENRKLNLTVKMLHAKSKKIVKEQSREYPADLSEIYHNLEVFVSDFLGLPRTAETPRREVRSPESGNADSEEKADIPYYDLNYVTEETARVIEPETRVFREDKEPADTGSVLLPPDGVEPIDTGAVYIPPDDSEPVDTGAIYYPEDNKLKKYLYWGLGALAVGGVSASIIALTGGDSGGGGSSSNLPDPPVFP